MVPHSISFALGIWLLQQRAALPDPVYAGLLLPLALLLLLPRRTAWQRAAAYGLSLPLACAAGFFLAAFSAQQRLADKLPAEWQGRDIEIIGVVAELPRRHERGLSFGFDVEKVLSTDARVPQHILLSTYANAQDAPLDLHAGERWQLSVRLKQPHGTANPHGFDFEAWMLERNLRASGYVRGKEGNARLDALVGEPGYIIESWREAVREHFRTALGDAPYTGVLTALAIGDQGSIPAAQWQMFTRTGVNHLMSISGLHITMLASLAFAFTYALWRRSTRLALALPARKAAALSGLLVALSYALLSGFSVPAQRTVYMLAVVAAALWLARTVAVSHMLAAALLAVLLADPWAVLAPGFWLSFCAVALILYISANRLGRAHWLVEYARVQWAMLIGLIPLLLALFQQVSLVSPVANAFAIPLVSFVVVPLALLGALLPFEWILLLAHQAMMLCMAMLEWLNRMPDAVWMQHAPPAWSIALGMMGALWCLLPRGFPARWLGLLLLLPMFLVLPAAPPDGTLRLVIFDVGQGLAVAAQTRSHTLLYDAGPDFPGEADSGQRILVPALRTMGIAQLDGLMLTHDDLDHTGGARSVMQAMPPSWISSSLPDGHPLLQATAPFSPSPSDGTTSHSTRLGNYPSQVADYPAIGRAESIHCTDGQSWVWDSVRFEVLHPAAESHAQGKIRDNERGCVLRISTGRYSVLLATDIERGSESRLLQQHADQLPATLLVVPHHGSKTSSSQPFVDAVHPRYAVFTIGYRNRFGHPKEEVLERYRAAGSELLRSDADGAILVEMNAENFSIERWRKSHGRYWQQQP